MAKKLVEVAADIVQAQVAVAQMTSEEISGSLRKVFLTLQEMQKCEVEGTTIDVGQPLGAAGSEESSATQIDPMESILDDKVVCLECGTEMKQLTIRHLAAHGLTIREYKAKHGLPLRQPLSAKSLTKARSRAAKKRGLPEGLIKYQDQKRQKKETTETVAVEPPASKPAKKKSTKRSRKKADA